MKRYSRRILAFISLLMILSLVAACSPKGNNQSASDGEDVFEIVMVAKHEGIPWFDDMRKGVEEFNNEYKGKVKAWQIAPEGGDPAKQVQMVEDLIAQGVDAIAVVPNDPDAMRPVLERAKEKGIIIISHEAAGLADVVDYDVEAFDNKSFGVLMFDELAKAMSGKGKFAAMVGGLTMETHMEWYNAGMEHIKANYPDMTPISEQPYEDKNDDKIARDKALEILNAHPDLQGFVGTSVSAGSNMASVLKERNNTDVKVVSLGIPSVSGPYLEDGFMAHAQTWRPADAGYASVNLAYKILAGEEIKEGIDLGRPGYESIKITNKVVYGNAPLELKKGTFEPGKYPF
ncbi:ABC transporter substrate-binding protein [Tissierella sp. P1]|uniref:autoinducer 2 ABC transporter substrate-binding protein n=1 Tax=Tissierella sp. P1 TaxID=1280483 RepID=UPI000BA0B294|nr:autoinducer 2 ABC transporter substrate-binding protein [Tissierella sp. P1]OZV12155.1 ABC transporter substrate-binding protein [Tissierella sp. P1]